MNKKYISEKNLRNKYESYQMAFENEAFEKFKLELDKEEQQNKVFWWKRLGLFLIPIFLVGFVSTYALFHYQKASEFLSRSDLQNQESTTTQITSLSVSDTTSQSDIESYPKVHSNQIDPAPNNVKSLGKESTSETATQVSTSTQTVQVFSNNTSDNEIQSSLPSTITTDPKVSDWHLNPTEVHSSTSQSTKLESSATSEILALNSDELDIAEKDTRRSIISKTVLPMLNFPILEKSQLDHLYLLNDEIKPYIKPFKKYFYINPRGGFVINDNFGSTDPYLSILKAKEFTYGGVFAYQFSPNYALELSFAQHDFSVGHYIENSSYSRKSGTKATVIKAALVSKLWSPFDGLNFNMTTGVAFMSGDNGSFGKGSSGGGTPIFIQNAILERFNISESKHYLYAGGLQATIRLSKNLECSLSSEYNMGFGTWIDTRLKYFEGEGVIRTVDSRSDGSFFGFNIGLKYSLRK